MLNFHSSLAIFVILLINNWLYAFIIIIILIYFVSQILFQVNHWAIFRDLLYLIEVFFLVSFKVLMINISLRLVLLFNNLREFDLRKSNFLLIHVKVLIGWDLMQFYFRVIDLKSVVAGSLLQCMLQNRPFRLWREVLGIKNIRTDFSSALYMICSSVNHLFPNVISLLKSLDFYKQSLNICVLLPDLRLASSNHVFKHLDFHLLVHF